MLAWIEFTTEGFGGWSRFTFWTVIISVILTLGFTVAVFIGGIGDLRFLLQAMGQDTSDDAGEGSVAESPEDPSRRET